MRLGLIGDVHAESSLLRTVLQALDKLGVDRKMCVGDIADGSESVDECCRLLHEHSVLTVKGNHDGWIVDNQMRELEDADGLGKNDMASVETVAGLTVINVGTLKRTHHPCFVVADMQNQSATRFDIQKDGTFEPGEAWNLGQAPG